MVSNNANNTDRSGNPQEGQVAPPVGAQSVEYTANQIMNLIRGTHGPERQTVLEYLASPEFLFNLSFQERIWVLSKMLSNAEPFLD